jgi:hypothetical protein
MDFRFQEGDMPVEYPKKPSASIVHAAERGGGCNTAFLAAQERIYRATNRAIERVKTCILVRLRGN